MDKISEIKNRLSEISLGISRVPIKTKGEFISLANAEFAGDYGMTLQWIFNQAMEYQAMKALFFDKLDNMENKIDSLLKQEQKTEPKVVKTFSGRGIELKGGENGQS